MRRGKERGTSCTLGLLLTLLVTAPTLARLGPLEQISVETFAKLREVERYQLGIAEKHYLQGEWEVALAEYEKFLTLYETSEAAPHAQLMWSNCQVNLRRVNTAIRDGFGSVIDYWPDAPEAIVAAYRIAECLKSTGEIKPAKKAYGALIREHPEHLVAALARVDLIDIARVEEDLERQVALLEDLTFRSGREGEKRDVCVRASRDLASHHTHRGSYDEARRALETSYEKGALLDRLYEISLGGIRHLSREGETREKGHALADRIIADLREAMPTDLSDEKAKATARHGWYRIANVHAHAYRDPKVLETYELVRERFGTDDEILGRIAAWLRDHKRRDEARAIYERFENRVEGQSQIARMHREEGAYDPAIAIYRELLELDAEHADGWQWQIAECYEASKRYTEAIQSYRQCDRFPESYNRMAGCHRRLEAYDEALVLYHQVLSLEAAAPEALLQIGHTYEEAGQREKAIQSFQQVCKRYPRTGQASRSHAHLQTSYKINVTLGGAKDE